MVLIDKSHSLPSDSSSFLITFSIWLASDLLVAASNDMIDELSPLKSTTTNNLSRLIFTTHIVTGQKASVKSGIVTGHSQVRMKLISGEGTGN